MSAATHYEVLGISPLASTDEVRKAYLRRARLLHPDLAQGLPPERSAQMARAMQDVNEAWRVLRVPTSRAAYDDRVAGRATVTPRPNGARPAGWGDAQPVGWGDAQPVGWGDVDLDPTPYHQRPAGMIDPGVSIVRSLPWIAALVVLGAIFVFTAFAGGAGEDNRRSSSDLVGKCVQSQQGVGVVEVACESRNEGRVDLVVNRQSQCPTDAIARSVPGEGTWVCLRRAG